MDDKLKIELIKQFGTMIEKDYDLILAKIGAIIAAHCFAGNVGDNPLCVLNRALESIIIKEDIK